VEGFFFYFVLGVGGPLVLLPLVTIVPAQDESWRVIHPNATLSTTHPMWNSLELDLEYQSGQVVPL